MEKASDASSFIPLRSIAKKSLRFLVKVSSRDKYKQLVVREIQLLEESPFGPHIVQPNGVNTAEGLPFCITIFVAIVASGTSAPMRILI